MPPTRAGRAVLCTPWPGYDRLGVRRARERARMCACARVWPLVWRDVVSWVL